MYFQDIFPNRWIGLIGLLSWCLPSSWVAPVWAEEPNLTQPHPDIAISIAAEVPRNSLQSTSQNLLESAVHPAASDAASDPVPDTVPHAVPVQTDQATQTLEAIQASQEALLPLSVQPEDTADNTADNGLDQVTSVNQLTDVQPTDWAYQALQSLVERYGCIVGYPDGTYRGQRALTRFEFAAGMNACLDRINELLAASTEDLATQDDLATLQRLQEEFAAELAQLRGRVDGLEARVSELEANQFSTTVRLSGSTIMAVSDAFFDGSDNQVIGQYRQRFLLNGSFTGEDNLLMGFYIGNATGDNFETGGFDLPGFEVTDPAGTTTETVSTQEGGLASTIGATTDNGMFFLASAYSFPVGDQLMVNLAVGRAPYYFFTPTLNGIYTSDEGTGAIGTFARLDPGYLLVSGGTGVVLSYDITDSLQLAGGYLADGGTVANSDPGNGLFNGGYGVLGQLTWNITDDFAVAGLYMHDYATGGKFGFNNNGLGSTGTAIANTLAGQDLLGGENFGVPQDPVVTNGYSAQFSWQISSQFILSGWFGSYYPRLIERGDGNILTYALTLAVRDVIQDGNLLGFAVGAEPYLTRMGGDPIDFDVDVPLHIEAFYRHQLNDNISITPGVIWLTAPNQSNDNPDVVLGTIRTTFTF